MKKTINLADREKILNLMEQLYTDGTKNKIDSQLDSERATRTESIEPVGENSAAIA